MTNKTVFSVDKTTRYNKSIDLGIYALKTTLLINGGAAIALLAYMGSISTIDIQKDTVVSLTNAIRAFSSGVLFAAIAGAAGFFSEASAYSKQLSKERLYFYVVVISGILSLVAFMYGMYASTEGIHAQFLQAEERCINHG